MRSRDGGAACGGGVAAAPTIPLANIRGGGPADLVAKRDLAVRRLTTGKGEYEGVYVRPDPRGVDADPDGLVIYDQREVTDAAADDGGYLGSAAGAAVLADTRVWTLANNAAPV